MTSIMTSIMICYALYNVEDPMMESRVYCLLRDSGACRALLFGRAQQKVLGSAPQDNPITYEN